MNLGALIGLILGLVILLGAAFTGSADTGGMGSLWDATSMAIVVGGAIAATCIAYPLADVIAALSGFPKVFGAQGFTLKDVVEIYKNTPYIGDMSPGGKYVAKDLYEVGGVPIVTAEGYLVGMITNRDLKYEEDRELPVTELMTPSEQLITASPGITLEKAKQILHQFFGSPRKTGVVHGITYKIQRRYPFARLEHHAVTQWAYRRY